MPLVGFTCPGNGLRVPFDHFETCTHGVNGTPAFPPWAARCIVRNEQEDIRHNKLQLTVTRLYSCPRAELLKFTTDYHANPVKLYKRIRGTEMHKVMAANSDGERWYTEANDPVRLTVAGRLFGEFLCDVVGVDAEDSPSKGLVTREGVELSGKIDMLARDLLCVCDGKFPSDWSVKWRDKHGHAEASHAVQLNVQRLLLGQQKWFRDEGGNANNIAMKVWDHSVGSSDGPLCMTALPMTEDEILTTYAFEGDVRSVGENLVEWVEMLREVAGSNDNDATVLHTPCTGASRFGGKGCTSYCDVNLVAGLTDYVPRGEGE